MGSVTNFAQRTTVLGFLEEPDSGAAEMSGGWGGLPEVCVGPARGVEGWVEDMETLPAAGMLQVGKEQPRRPWTRRGSLCLSTVGESLQPRVTGEASIVTARSCPLEACD